MSRDSLHDAEKRIGSRLGWAFLEWDFHYTQFSKYAARRVLLPEKVVDQIIAWRDADKAKESRT